MKRLIKEFTAGNAMLSVLAVVASFIVGGILIAVSSEEVQTTIGYITARPSDFFNALWNAVFGAYDAMFRGAIFNYKATSFVQMIKPITETLAYATPITMAGLGLAHLCVGLHDGGRRAIRLAAEGQQRAHGHVGLQQQTVNRRVVTLGSHADLREESRRPV